MQEKSDGLNVSQKILLSKFDIVKSVKVPLKNIVDNDKINNICLNMFQTHIKVDDDKFKLNKITIQNFLHILNDIIRRINVIKYHTYNFLRLFVLYEYEKFGVITEIDDKYVLLIMKIISYRNSKGGRPSKSLELENKLVDFFNNHYSKTIDKNQLVCDDRLSFALHYESLDIVKNIDVNISEHFTDHLNKYIDIYFELKSKKEKIKLLNISKEEKTILYKKM